MDHFWRIIIITHKNYPCFMGQSLRQIKFYVKNDPCFMGHFDVEWPTKMAHVLWVIFDVEFDGNIHFNVWLNLSSRSGQGQVKKR